MYGKDSVDRAVASNTRGGRFDSLARFKYSRRQFLLTFILIEHLLSVMCMEDKKRCQGMANAIKEIVCKVRL